MYEVSEVDTEFHEQLALAQEERPDLFPGVKDIETEFGINRSLRRGSVSRALAQGLKEEVDVQNRWRKKERAEGSMPYAPMREHYSDIRLLAPLIVPYSKAM